MSDTQCRKWQITINNPANKGGTHDRISKELRALKSIVYYCMADEAGQTHHTHVFAAFSSAVRFSTLKAHFPEAHLETARGSTAQTDTVNIAVIPCVRGDDFDFDGSKHMTPNSYYPLPMIRIQATLEPGEVIRDSFQPQWGWNADLLKVCGDKIGTRRYGTATTKLHR